MKKPILFIFALLLLQVGCKAPENVQSGTPTQRSTATYGPLAQQYKSVADKIIAASLADSVAWDRMAEMSDRFGARFSGSQNLEDALDWIIAELKKDGLEKIATEEVMVPNWKRGKEWLKLVSPRPMDLPVMALGGSIGTPPEGIQAEAIVVSSFDELSQKADQVRGKILVFNAPFTSYGETVQYRVRGASLAARHGAVASIIRSVGPYSMVSPHTGGMGYEEGIPKVPAMAMASEHSDMLARMQARGQKVVLQLYSEARMEPDAKSRNVMVEITGREKPEEVVVIGGHIDSWDVGLGAMDDGGGTVVSWQVLNVLKKLGLRPRRTIRVVFWTNEENGLRGGQKYMENQGEKVKDHILAIESDAGVFKPKGFGFTGSEAARKMIEDIATLLNPIESGQILRGGGGADIGPLMQKGVPGMGLNVDGTKYFWYHHTHADTPDKLDPREMGLCVATMAVMAYIVAEMPERLPR